MANFRIWLSEFVVEEKICDVIMLGDGREPHAAAIAARSQYGLDCRIWVVEHGYLRPDLILIEPDGMGGRSSIPERYSPNKDLPEPTPATRWSSSFFRYGALDVAYHLTNLCFAPFFYPHYRAHSGISPVKEYTGWVKKALRRRSRRKALTRSEAEISRHSGPIYLFPLQLSQDFQLRSYGTGEDQSLVLERVITSFQDHAPSDALLVVKVHPLDNGLTDWAGEVCSKSGRLPIVFLDGGDLDNLLPRTAGVVTINSTVGLTAILAGCATCVLGSAMYDLPDLTYDQKLDSFWSAPRSPDPSVAKHFSEYLRTTWHVSGAFDGPGSKAGAQALADWLSDPPFETESIQS